MKLLSRRSLFRGAAITSGIGMGMVGLVTANAQELCDGISTPAQTAGPFYPEQPVANWEPDTDLTRIAGASSIAVGQKIIVAGAITNLNCQPIEGAELQIWQADYQGVYNHSRDPRANIITPDPNFQYWASKITKLDGVFSFLTIKPGAYPAGGTWIRPQHIHLRVVAPGYLPVISQVYFAPDDADIYDVNVLAVMPNLVRYYQTNGGKAVTTVLQRLDGILAQVPNPQKESVILRGQMVAAPASLQSEEPENPNIMQYTLNIRLRKDS